MIIFEFERNDFLTSIIHYDSSTIGFLDGTYVCHDDYVFELIRRSEDFSLDSYIYGL